MSNHSNLFLATIDAKLKLPGCKCCVHVCKDWVCYCKWTSLTMAWSHQYSHRF